MLLRLFVAYYCDIVLFSPEHESVAGSTQALTVMQKITCADLPIHLLYLHAHLLDLLTSIKKE